MLADNLSRHAERPAVVDGAVRLSYAELDIHMQRIAAGLAERDLGPGDAVALWAPNSWQWLASALACWWRGCIVVPIPSRGKILDALPILQATQARLLFTCAATDSGDLPALIARHLLDTRSTLQELCPRLHTIVDFSGAAVPGTLDIVSLARFAATASDATPVPAADVAAGDTCAILFTSGSTGRPKGVLRRHGQALASRWRRSLARRYTHADRLLVVSEFSHSLGLSSNLICSLEFGATLVIAHSRNPADIAALIRTEQISTISAPPSLFAGLLRERIGDEPACAHLRLALTAATNIPPDLVRGLCATGVDAVVSAYGMTECEIIASTELCDPADVIATTVGKPVAELELRIADGDGAALPAEVAGEIWVRGPATSTWYLGADAQRQPVLDAEGWLHTGDMGCLTADGYLRILGRKKDAMTIHGYTLYPAEIEVLLSQSGMLKDIAVIGVPHALAGELCVACIVPAYPSTFSLQRLRVWARTNMADYKIPARFVLLDHLPLNQAGKVDRLALVDSLHA